MIVKMFLGINLNFSASHIRVLVKVLLGVDVATIIRYLIQNSKCLAYALVSTEDDMNSFDSKFVM